MKDKRINKFYSYDEEGEIPCFFLYEKNVDELKKDLQPPYTSYTFFSDDAERQQRNLSKRINHNVTFVKLDPGVLLYLLEIDPEETEDNFELWHVIAGDKFGWILVEKQHMAFKEVVVSDE